MRPERRPGSLGNEASETGLRHELRALSAVLPYLWPKESRDLRLRVVLAVACLILAKLITVGVPLLYKAGASSSAAR
jgi:hypothetical protein